MAEAEAAAGRAGPPVRVRHAHRASLDERQMHSAAGGAGGGGRGGGARAIGGGQEGRLADDKRALLRCGGGRLGGWEHSVVQSHSNPKQATTLVSTRAPSFN